MPHHMITYVVDMHKKGEIVQKNDFQGSTVTKGRKICVQKSLYFAHTHDIVTQRIMTFGHIFLPFVIKLP